jgi:hypothetical protein
MISITTHSGVQNVTIATCKPDTCGIEIITDNSRWIQNGRCERTGIKKGKWKKGMWQD